MCFFGISGPHCLSVAFSQTIRDWNALSDSLIPSAEGAEDAGAKFTSLVRAGD